MGKPHGSFAPSPSPPLLPSSLIKIEGGAGLTHSGLVNLTSEIQLPSNRKFGWFFTAIFSLAALYSWWIDSSEWLYALSGIGALFFTATVLRADVLLPLNKAWMRFGFILGMIISPIVMGLIFFGIFSPIGILMRIFGRDELQLRVNQRASHWVNREQSTRVTYFENQF